MHTAAIATFKKLVASHGTELIKNVNLDATVKLTIDANEIAKELGTAVNTVFKKIGNAFSGNHLGMTIINLSGHELQMLSGWPYAPQPARGLLSHSLLESAAEVTLEPGEVDGAAWKGVGLDACCTVYAYKISGTDDILTFSVWVPATGNTIGTLVSKDKLSTFTARNFDMKAYFKKKYKLFATSQSGQFSLTSIEHLDLNGVAHTFSASIGTDRKLRVKFERSDLNL